jgi:hypothetical protein
VGHRVGGGDHADVRVVRIPETAAGKRSHYMNFVN